MSTLCWWLEERSAKYLKLSGTLVDKFSSYVNESLFLHVTCPRAPVAMLRHNNNLDVTC